MPNHARRNGSQANVNPKILTQVRHEWLLIAASTGSSESRLTESRQGVQLIKIDAKSDNNLGNHTRHILLIYGSLVPSLRVSLRQIILRTTKVPGR